MLLERITSKHYIFTTNKMSLKVFPNSFSIEQNNFDWFLNAMDRFVKGVLVGTNSGALGLSEAELGLTEATAVGAAIWRIAGTAAVRG